MGTQAHGELGELDTGRERPLRLPHTVRTVQSSTTYIGSSPGQPKLTLTLLSSPLTIPQIICPWSVLGIDITQLYYSTALQKNRTWNPTCYHLPFSQVAVSSRRIKLCLRRSQTPGTHTQEARSSPFPKPYRPHGQAGTLGSSMECYLPYHLIPPHCCDQLRQGLNGHSLSGLKELHRCQQETLLLNYF